MNIIVHSIQDYLKRINSRLTKLNILSISITTILILGFTVYLYDYQIKSKIPVSYLRSNINQEKISATDSRPFASIKGTTYTFSWCQGSNIITAKNRMYFNNQEEAQKSGRILSKLCQK